MNLVKIVVEVVIVVIALLCAIFNTILIMPFIRHTFDFVDATVNRNSDRENGAIYPVTPTKELNSDFGSSKHHVSVGQRAFSCANMVLLEFFCIYSCLFFSPPFRWVEVVIVRIPLR